VAHAGIGAIQKKNTQLRCALGHSSLRAIKPQRTHSDLRQVFEIFARYFFAAIAAYTDYPLHTVEVVRDDKDRDADRNDQSGPRPTRSKERRRPRVVQHVCAASRL
jgi:hypothetical protein